MSRDNDPSGQRGWRNPRAPVDKAVDDAIDRIRAASRGLTTPLTRVDRFEVDFNLPSLPQLVDNLELLLRNRLWLQILIGMVSGIAVGLLIAPSGAALVGEEAAQTIAEWLAIPGQLFLALIQMMMIPLVVSSVMLGIAASGDIAYIRRMGFRIGIYFVATTTIAVLIGIAIAALIQPGDFVDPADLRLVAGETPADLAPVTLEDVSLPERLVGVIPTDPLQAALDRSMLQIVVAAILVGIAIVTLPDEHERTLIDITGAVQELSLRVIGWAMLLAPLAVFGLLAQVMVDIGFDVIVGMSVYVGTVLLGLLLLLLVYLLIATVFGRQHPGRFLRTIREPQLLAFSTSSSAAVMPLSMQTAEDKLNVSQPVARFVLPLGATVNMDGTALYQVIATLFLTQAFAIDVAPWELLLLVVTIVGASIGSPGTPGVGIVILATILGNIGVPASGVALIIGVDRILDMSRTAVNVTGDLTACTVMERWIGSEPPEPTSPTEASPQPQAT